MIYEDISYEERLIDSVGRWDNHRNCRLQLVGHFQGNFQNKVQKLSFINIIDILNLIYITDAKIITSSCKKFHEADLAEAIFWKWTNKRVARFHHRNWKISSRLLWWEKIFQKRKYEHIHEFDIFSLVRKFWPI